jgi:hypothetical protein
VGGKTKYSELKWSKDSPNLISLNFFANNFNLLLPFQNEYLNFAVF